MAKNKYKSKDGKKWIAVLCGFVIIALMIVYIIVSSVTGTWNPACWLPKDQSGTEQPNPDADNKPDDGGTHTAGGAYTDVKETENNGIRLMSARIAPEEYEDYGISPQTEDAYTITAVVKDETGASPEYLQAVTYSVGWTSETSEKLEEFIEYEQSGMTLTFRIKGAFNTQITLTCTSEVDTSVSGRATVDYRKRLVGYNVGFPANTEIINSWNNGSATLTMPDVSSSLGTYDVKNLTFMGSPIYGRGTVDASVGRVVMTVKATDEFKTACGGNSYLTCDGTLSLNDSPSYLAKQSLANLFQTVVGNSCIGYTGARYSLYRALSQTNNQFVATGTLYTGSGNYEFRYYINVSAVAPAVSDIEFDTPSFTV